MLILLRQREPGHQSEALRINVLKKELVNFRKKYGLDSRNQNFTPEKELFQNVFFGGNLEDMTSLFFIYSRCPKVRDYRHNAPPRMVSALWKAFESLEGEIIYPNQSDIDGPNSDAFLSDCFRTQITANLRKIETDANRAMFMLVLTELSKTEAELPSSIMNHAWNIPKMWKEINESKAVMKASL